MEHVNRAPVANDDTYNTSENTSLTIYAPGVLENDVDLEGESLSVELVSEPKYGSLNLNPDGSFFYQPNMGFHGLDYFAYAATDGLLLSNAATVFINVNTDKDPPVAFDDNYITIKNTTLAVDIPGVLKNDYDPSGGILSTRLESEPLHGSLQLQPLGDFTYQPETNFIGEVTFTYTAESWQLFSNIATVTIAIVEKRELYLPMLIR